MSSSNEERVYSRTINEKAAYARHLGQTQPLTALSGLPMTDKKAQPMRCQFANRIMIEARCVSFPPKPQLHFNSSHTLNEETVSPLIPLLFKAFGNAVPQTACHPPHFTHRPDIIQTIAASTTLPAPYLSYSGARFYPKKIKL